MREFECLEASSHHRQTVRTSISSIQVFPSPEEQKKTGKEEEDSFVLLLCLFFVWPRNEECVRALQLSHTPQTSHGRWTQAVCRESTLPANILSYFQELPVLELGFIGWSRVKYLHLVIINCLWIPVRHVVKPGVQHQYEKGDLKSSEDWQSCLHQCGSLPSSEMPKSRIVDTGSHDVD